MAKSHTYVRGGETYMVSEHYIYLLQSGLIVDCSPGGLIMGPSKGQGGIQMIHPNRDAEIFIAQLTEGWHFLINAFASHYYEEELTHICQPSMTGDAYFRPYLVPTDIDIITVTPRGINGVLTTPHLYFGTNSMMVVNKKVAKNNIQRLTQLNRQAWQTYFIDANPEPTIRESAALARFSPKSDN